MRARTELRKTPPLSFDEKDLAHCAQAWETYSDLRSKQKNTTVKWISLGVGHGLFAAEDIAAGELVVEYTGNRLTMDIVELGDDIFNFDRDTEEYSVRTASGRMVIDASDGSDQHIARFANHGCDPNCEYATVDLAENDHSCEPIEAVFIYAIKNIRKGEQLRCCYGWCMSKCKYRRQCDCGSMNCSDIVGVRGYPRVVDDVIDGSGPSGCPIGSRNVVKFRT